MEYRKRIYYTDSQKSLMWDRWQQGESLHQIAALFDRRDTSKDPGRVRWHPSAGMKHG